MTKAKVCVPVAEKALLMRINRKLAKEGRLQVKKLRGELARTELGDFYLLDLNRNAIKATHLDLEAYARELGVLAPYEALNCTS